MKNTGIDKDGLKVTTEGCYRYPVSMLWIAALNFNETWDDVHNNGGF